LADRRIDPAVDIPASGTRRDELLGEPAEVAGRLALRKQLAGLAPAQAIESLQALMRRSKTNADLLAGMKA
jgi:transcription termination factor Rho